MECVDCGAKPAKARGKKGDVLCGPCWRYARKPPNCGNCGRFVPWANLAEEHYQEYSTVVWKCDYCGEWTRQD